MSKNTKILIAFVTTLPILGIVYYMYNFFKMFFAISNRNLEIGSEDAFMGNFMTMFVSLGISILIGLAMLAFYIYQIVNNKKLEQNERLMWILIVFFASSIGCLIYWYLKIWKEGIETEKEIS